MKSSIGRFERVRTRTRHSRSSPSTQAGIHSERNSRSDRCELPRATALWPTRPSRVELGAFWFCVRTCTRRHKRSRTPQQIPFTSGSECPAPTGSTLGPHVRRTLVFGFGRRRQRGERLTHWFQRSMFRRGETQEGPYLGFHG